MPSASTTTPPTTLSHETETSEILSSLNHHGAVVVTDFTSSPTILKVIAELRGSSTALASKSPTFVNSFLLDKKVLQILDACLSKTTKIWHGEERLTNTSRPQLSATVVFDLQPGRKAEPLHRHDDIYFVDHPLDIAVEIWALWNLGNTKLSAGNGAPDLILGSHKWGDEWEPNGHELTSLSIPPGACLLLHGSTVHRGGSNDSEISHRILGASWTQGHMRQEENQYLAISKEETMKLDEKTKILLGYRINAPFGGFYELRDPMTYFAPEGEVVTSQGEGLDGALV